MSSGAARRLLPRRLLAPTTHISPSLVIMAGIPPQHVGLFPAAHVTAAVVPVIRLLLLRLPVGHHGGLVAALSKGPRIPRRIVKLIRMVLWLVVVVVVGRWAKVLIPRVHAVDGLPARAWVDGISALVLGVVRRLMVSPAR